MTTKEIAGAIGKDYSTVTRWIERVSCKVQEVSCKVQEAKATSKPADYDLAETCLIIEEGMGKDVADVFRMNAEKPTHRSSETDHKIMAELRRGFDRGLLSADEYRAGVGLNYPKTDMLDPAIAKQIYAVAFSAFERKKQKQLIEDNSGKLDL